MAHAYHEGFVTWDYHKACRELEDFVVNDLSNWYVRRSRRRLWDGAQTADKLACQHTLHEVLTTVCRLVAPVAPFMVDVIHRNLNGEAVHQAAWPLGVPGALEGATADAWDADAEADDGEPASAGCLARSDHGAGAVAETGRRIRVDANRRQRLPCREGWIVAGPDLSAFHDLLEEELNVEAIQAEADLDRFQRLVLAPNFVPLRPRRARR